MFRKFLIAFECRQAQLVFVFKCAKIVPQERLKNHAIESSSNSASTSGVLHLLPSLQIL